jgi:hypothetical protein
VSRYRTEDLAGPDGDVDAAKIAAASTVPAWTVSRILAAILFMTPDAAIAQRTEQVCSE